MATIPDHDRAAAIFTLRNRSFEFVVGNGMIFDLNRQPLFAWYKTRAACYCPAFHHAIEFEAKIIVQTPCRVLLDDKRIAALARHRAFRFGSDIKPALGSVSL